MRCATALREAESYAAVPGDATGGSATKTDRLTARRPLQRRRYGSLCSSTRRFCARPAAVVFGATGLPGPKPRAVMRVGLTPFAARYARTALARASERRRFSTAEPVLSVYPAISIRTSGFATNASATWASTMYESGVSADLPVSKFTPRSTSVGRGFGPGPSGVGANSTMHPCASTLEPGGVLGHLSRSSGTPSPSASPGAAALTTSFWTGHPGASTTAPGGVLGPLSRSSGTPSPPASFGVGEPVAFAPAPGAGSGSWALRPGTPSPSVSTGHPFASTVAPAGVLGHWSMPSGTPSASLSIGQPFGSTRAPSGVLGHLSFESSTPSWSESLIWRPSWNRESPTVPT